MNSVLNIDFEIAPLRAFFGKKYITNIEKLSHLHSCLYTHILK